MIGDRLSASALLAFCVLSCVSHESATVVPGRIASVPIRGTDVSVELVRVATPEGPLWFGRTEVTWDAYDPFVHGRDGTGVDAVSRPTQPYITVDRGFGHEGFPAISMSYRAAQSFCAWLSAQTDLPFRLPTEKEWKLACGSSPADPGSVAWYASNAGGRTHAVATRVQNERGLHDVFGNAAEWCVGTDGRGVLLGGSFLDREVGPEARREPSGAWNASDPQIPKSIWWLADAPFAGFRVVCEADVAAWRERE